MLKADRYTNDYTKDTLLHFGEREMEEIRLELPLRFSAQMQILHPAAYDIEFATRRLADHIDTMLYAQAMSLYSYARFESEKLTIEYPTWHVGLEHRSATPFDHIKAWLEKQRNKVDNKLRQWGRDHAARVGDKPYNNGLLAWPKRWKARYITLQVIDRSKAQKSIERIQEALLAQIALLHNYNLEPQAVLAHPEMAMELAAFRRLPGQFEMLLGTARTRTFAGLPVIECQELTCGAIVV